MSRLFVLIIYIFAIFLVFLTFTFGHKTLNGERLIKYENALPSKQEFMKKNEKKFDLIAKIIVNLSFIFMLVSFVYPAILDIPTVVTGNYPIIEGEAMSPGATGNRIFPKSVNVKSSESNEILQLQFYTPKNIMVGDHLKLVYLPHLKYATLVEQE